MSLEVTSTFTDFHIEEMFFSRTDLRGIIQSSNRVFQRVSGHEWSELIGAPHKIVRHPDMPKGVFHLLWSTIKAGKVIGAFVCNRSKSGGSYWVFATMFPLEDGYLSVRIKPSTQLLDKIVPVYNALTARERAGELTPEASAEALQEQIAALGYASYQDFMTIALTSELQAHGAAVDHEENAALAALSETLESTHALEAATAVVQSSFRSTHQIPYNMRLQAGRVESSDGPISVISSNHRQMSFELEKIVAEFATASQASSKAIFASSLEVAISKLLADMHAVLAREPEESLPRKHESLDLLAAFSRQYQTAAFDTLTETARRMRHFRKQCRQMRRALSGLELTRIMCKIERSRLTGEASGLDEIVSRLALAQDALEGSCNEIERLATLILNLSESLLTPDAHRAA